MTVSKTATTKATLLVGLDPEIRTIVEILRHAGIETFESCQGGKGHCFPEPTIRFYGSYGAGFRALGICYDYGIRVSELRRVWKIEGNSSGGEPVGPGWELVFLLPQYQPNLMRPEDL